MSSLFISDLHLSANSAVQLTQYQQLLATHAGKLDSLYILGDFFDFWIGDDAATDLHRMAVEPIRQLASLGTKIFFAHGNRDFSIGEAFLDYMQATLMSTPTVHTLYGQKILLLHGDELCTDDVEYQKLRTQIRNPQFIEMMMSKSIEERLIYARDLRAKSKMESASKAEDIMDVNQHTVTQHFEQYDTQIMIHGHTHRPAIHKLHNNAGEELQRIVLGDWQDQPSYLLMDENGFELVDTRIRQKAFFPA